MKHGSLFSGIGGFDLAADWMGWENVFHCELKPFGQKILNHYWPNAISYNDITKTDFTIHERAIDVLTGGFPCQKFSIAGSQTGDYSLIIEMLRAIGEIESDWIVAENVGNILNKKFKDYLDFFVASLEDKGYQIPLVFDCTADAVGLPSMERHIWFITQANSKRQKRSTQKTLSQKPSLARKFSGSYQGEYNRWKLPSNRVSELGEGISERLDTEAISKTKWHGESIEGLGNAINPQVAFEIFKIIEYGELTM